MHYALLIYQAEGVSELRSQEDLEKALAAHRHFQKKAKDSNTFVVASELVPSHAATTVRDRSGKVTIIDGPFAETKEQFIGLYILECKNLDEAIEYAKLVPDVRTGSVEIRPVAHLEA